MFTLGQSSLFSRMRLYGGGRSVSKFPPPRALEPLTSTIHIVPQIDSENTPMNNLDCISSANRRYIIVFPVLVAFGVLYNAWIAKQEQSYKDEGRVSLYVVSGCAVTLSGAALLNWRGALIVFLCFVSSGLPMILGSLTRYFKLIERAERFIRQ